MKGTAGYTVVELLVATAVLLAATGGMFQLLDDGVARSGLWNEAADLHQRGRVGVEAMSSVISAAGAGPDATSLAHSFAAAEPRRRTSGGVSAVAITVRYAPENAPLTTLTAPLAPGEQIVRIARHPGCADGTVACGFHSDMTVVVFDRAGNWDTVLIESIAPDTLTVIDRPVPRSITYEAGAQLMQVTETALYYEPLDGTLRREHAGASNLPLLDNVVDLRFEYFGDPLPPVTPRPPTGIANCLYDASGARVPLPTLSSDHGALASLTLAMLSDGPMCGSGATAYDVDLLRIRKIRATVRLQTGVAMLRGPDPRLFFPPRLGTRIEPDAPRRQPPAGVQSAKSSAMSRLGREDGSALLLAMTLTLMLAAAGAAAALTARMETLLAASFTQSQQALSVAEGGLARALQELSPQPNWTSVLAGIPSTFTDGGSFGARQLPSGEGIVMCCGAGSLTGDLQRRGHGGQTWGSNTPQWRLYAWGPASSWLARVPAGSVFYVIVWVADDVEDGDGDASSDSNGSILVRSLALGPGRARRSVQATVQHARGEDGLPLERGVAVITSRETRW